MILRESLLQGLASKDDGKSGRTLSNKQHHKSHQYETCPDIRDEFHRAYKNKSILYEKSHNISGIVY